MEIIRIEEAKEYIEKRRWKWEAYRTKIVGEDMIFMEMYMNGVMIGMENMAQESR